MTEEEAFTIVVGLEGIRYCRPVPCLTEAQMAVCAEAGKIVGDATIKFIDEYIVRSTNTNS